MATTEGQKAKARGENNDKINRAVVASLSSCPPWGAATGHTTNTGKISKNIKPPPTITLNKLKKKKQQARHPPSQAGLLSYHKNNNDREKERNPKHNRVAFEAAAEVGGTNRPRQILPSSRRGTLLPCLLSPSCFRQPPYDCYPPPFHPLGHHPQRMRGAFYSHPLHPYAI